MKLKKVLALLLCAAMVLSTMGTVVFANDSKVAKIGNDEYTTLEEALANAKEGDVVIELLENATINVSDAYIKLGTEETTSITINGNGNRLDLTTTYWSRLNMTNSDAKLILNNMTVNSSQETGTWNSYDVTFLCPVELNDVNFEKAIALDNDATLKRVTITETHDYYAIWITAKGQKVEIDGLTINSDGRGIKIDEQYIDSPKKVELTVENAKFKTENKAAIVVKSEVGAIITANNNVDITGVVADSSNIVWVDEDAAEHQENVTVNGGAPYLEAAVAKIGDVYYTDLQEAITTAAPAGTVDIIADVTVDTWIQFQQGNRTYPKLIYIDMNGLTINGNNHTLTVNSIESGNNGNQLFSGAENLNVSDLTIKVVNGAGGISLKSGKIENVTFDGGVYGVYPGTGDITITGCTFSTNGTAIYYENASDNLIVTGNTFNQPADKTVILLRGNTTFTDNTINSGRTVNVVSGSPVVSGNDFGNVRLKVYNDAEATIENNKINNLVFNDETEVNATFAGNILSDEARAVLETATGWTTVAKIGDAEYNSLKAAIDGAGNRKTIKLVKDITEDVVIEAPAVALFAATGKEVVIDLMKHTLNGSILIKEGGVISKITIKNGNIINENSGINAVESDVELILNNVNVKSKRHAVRINGGKATINSGNYSLIPTKGMTQNVIYVRGDSEVIINGGTFVGPKGTVANSGTVVIACDTSSVKINNGEFLDGKATTIAGKEGTKVEIVGGIFDQDVTAYVADGYDCVDTGAYEDRYIVVNRSTSSAINVILEKADKDVENVYNIKLVNDGVYPINEFVAAEFTFENNSTTVGNKDMAYEVSGITENGVVKTVVEQSAENNFVNDKYIIRIPSGEEANRLSGDSFVIGQIKFIGQATKQFQGNIDFKIASGEVDATREGTHLGKYYTVADGTLKIDAAIINSTVSEIKRDVTVNVAFNHYIRAYKDRHWKNDQITATLKNNFGYNVTKDIKIADIKSGAVTFEDVPLGQISVTLEAPGFRTYTYKTVVEETADNGVLVLNFWNDVKRNDDEVIEAGKKPMAHNFLVGDIVMDYTVDKYDLAAVTSYYGTYDINKADAEKYIKYDLNRDGDIDIRDVQYVLHTMGN